MHFPVHGSSQVRSGRATPPRTGRGTRASDSQPVGRHALSPPGRQRPHAVHMTLNVGSSPESTTRTTDAASRSFQDPAVVDDWDVESIESDMTDHALESVLNLARAEEAAAVANAAVNVARTAALAAAESTSPLPTTPRRTTQSLSRSTTLSPLRSPFAMQTPRYANRRGPPTAFASPAFRTDFLPVVARHPVFIPQRPSANAIVPTSRYISDIKVSDILANPDLAADAGARIIDGPVHLNFFSVHPAHLKDADVRNRFAQQALRSAEASNACRDAICETMSITLQARATVAPGTAVINPSTDIKVLTTVPIRIANSPSLRGGLDLIEQVMRHALGADHAAWFGVRAGFKEQPVPVVEQRRIFFLPKKETYIELRAVFELENGRPVLDKMTDLAYGFNIPSLDINRYEDIICDTRSTALPTELWASAMRGTSSQVTPLMAARLVVAAIEDCIAAGWPLE